MRVNEGIALTRSAKSTVVSSNELNSVSQSVRIQLDIKIREKSQPFHQQHSRCLCEFHNEWSSICCIAVLSSLLVNALEWQVQNKDRGKSATARF